jgi:hypothetical protein
MLWTSIPLYPILLYPILLGLIDNDSIVAALYFYVGLDSKSPILTP